MRRVVSPSQPGAVSRRGTTSVTAPGQWRSASSKGAIRHRSERETLFKGCHEDGDRLAVVAPLQFVETFERRLIVEIGCDPIDGVRGTPTISPLLMALAAAATSIHSPSAVFSNAT